LGFFEEKSLQWQLQMEQELKENICREIMNISAEQLQRVKKNLFCLCVCGGTAFSEPPVL
jgi:hypothetical protein